MVERSNRSQSLLDDAQLRLDKQATRQNHDQERHTRERDERQKKGDAEISDMLNKKVQDYRDKYSSKI